MSGPLPFLLSGQKQSQVIRIYPPPLPSAGWKNRDTETWRERDSGKTER